MLRNMGQGATSQFSALEGAQAVPESSQAARFDVVAWCLARRWTILVHVSMAVWSVALFEKVRADHDNFRTLRYDLGNMVQAVWSTAHGRPLETTLGSGEQAERLASHVDPILALLAPVWLVAPTPLSLAAVQIAVVAAGALPVYGLARRHLGSEAAGACFAFVYLAYPWIGWTAADAMHPVTLAIPLLLFAIWFLDGDRIVPFAFVAVLTAMTGELMGLTIAALGVWYAFARGRRRIGLVTAALGVAWSVIAVKVIVPAFADGPSVYYSRYASVGGSPEGVLRTAVTDPLSILAALTGQGDLVYLFWLGAPLGALFVLSPGLALVALPQLLANGLSDRSTMTDPRFHYIAGAVPFLFAAAILGSRRLSPDRPLRGVSIILVSLLGSVALLLAAGPQLAGIEKRGERLQGIPPGHLESLRAAVRLVPADAPVSATNGAGAHLSARRYVYSAPVLGRAEWVVLDMWNSWMPDGPRGEGVYPGRLEAFRARLERSPNWEKAFDRADVAVFRRTSGG